MIQSTHDYIRSAIQGSQFDALIYSIQQSNTENKLRSHSPLQEKQKLLFSVLQVFPYFVGSSEKCKNNAK